MKSFSVCITMHIQAQFIRRHEYQIQLSGSCELGGNHKTWTVTHAKQSLS